MSQPFNLIVPFIEQKFRSVGWYNLSQKETPPAGDLDGTKMLRLDWELSTASEEFAPGQMDIERVKDLMITQLSCDMADLIVNGDTDSSDPLLKVFDGEQKLGIRFDDVYISDLGFYGEFKQAKDAYEFTVYLRAKGVIYD